VIFGIGLSKTGTTSLYAALNELGYRAATFRHLNKIGLSEWFRGNFEPDYLAGYSAATDLPIGTFYPQLDQRYPGSQFILTTRDSESWLRSARRQFSRNPDPPPGFIRDVRLVSYGISGFEPGRYLHVFETHGANVSRYFQHRPQDLLTLDIVSGEGWRELCTFLDKPLPSVPFPHIRPGYGRIGV